MATSKCTYCKRHYTKGYIRCERDGSIRKENKCKTCPKFKKKLITRILDWICGID